jgi:glycosyltransferase involved in cell wall biosynthesis
VDPTLGVIVPAYNEAATLEAVLKRVLRQPSVAQVVVVDDASTDGSLEIAQRFRSDARVQVIRHDRNRGKGAALQSGLQAITAPLVLIQDADLEYDPLDYARLIAPILEGRADVVYGFRGFAGHTAYSYWFVMGNHFVTTIANILFNSYIQDMATGFKVMRTELMRRLKLRANRFDTDAEITARLLRLGYRIHEIPITYYARNREEGKKVTWRDGVRALVTMMRIRLSSRTALFGQDERYHQERLRALRGARQLPELPDDSVRAA